VRWAGPLLALLVLAGCGGTTPAASHKTSAVPPTSPSASASALPDCLAGTGARRVVVTSDPTVLPAYLLGHGPDVVVASDQSDQDLCGWVPFARTLAADGFEVVLYDYLFSDLGDLGRVVRRVRADGARHVSLLGASEGAKASIVDAVRLRPRVASVVSLSAETYLKQLDVRRAGRRLHVPVLYLTAKGDEFGALAAGRDLDRVTPGPHRLVVVPGTAHGVDLLGSAPVRTQVAGFLRAHGR
jgi:pimeloyl-ACP methyl ester carboxylesterase